MASLEESTMKLKALALITIFLGFNFALILNITDIAQRVAIGLWLACICTGAGYFIIGERGETHGKNK